MEGVGVSWKRMLVLRNAHGAYIFAMSFFNFRYPFIQSSGRFRGGTRPFLFAENVTFFRWKTHAQIRYFECSYMGPLTGGPHVACRI